MLSSGKSVMTKHVPGRTKPAGVWKTAGMPAPDSKEAVMVRVQLSFDVATRGSAMPPSRAGEAEFCLLEVPEGPALSLAAPNRVREEQVVEPEG